MKPLQLSLSGMISRVLEEKNYHSHLLLKLQTLQKNNRSHINATIDKLVGSLKQELNKSQEEKEAIRSHIDC